VRAAIIAGAIVLVTIAARWVDVRSLSGVIKGDESTYIAEAFSLAYDRDFDFDRIDFERFQRINHQGPEGIFLKGISGVPTTSKLTYGKALAYPLFAAPFVAAGGIGGLLVFNFVLLAGCLWCAIRFCQARMGKASGAVLGVAFIVASVVPVFSAWLTSDLFNFSLVLFAYFLWLYKRVAPSERVGAFGGPWTDIVAAVLLGIAAYSKPPNVFLVGPLFLHALIRRDFKKSVMFATISAAACLSLFALTWYTSGEYNYQGAQAPNDRRTFVSRFPFDDAGTTFESAGGSSRTNDADTGVTLDPATLSMFSTNVYYFLIGRDAGLVPYFFPGVLVFGAFLLRIRQAALWQWTTLVVGVAATLLWLVITPYSWNGGGGPPGNRYFLSFYPAMLFLLPAGGGLLSGLVALIVGATFTGAMVLHPFDASGGQKTWRYVARAPLKWLPVELTMMDDLPIRLDGLRSRIVFIRDPYPTVFFYYMDPNTYFAEGNGLWVAGAATAEIVIRTELEVTRLDVAFSTRVANTVSIDFAGSKQTLSVQPGSDTQITMRPRKSFAIAKDGNRSYAYVLRLSTTAGYVPKDHEPSSDTRNLGVFLKPVFMYGEPPRTLGPSTPGGGGD